ncbi:MAG: TIGR00269 family protein [Candidatus Parvarchaeota archaeon]|nr:TIGR00269 family protein [Candidatus Jingweiarchaeum tengchongense]MCW1298486.1 TIGR00269 family protein [Candidatus Jingweiarchaeum tengchongense]MCW1300268.1 TIGR00269 family protein [Candidatus Jingweiarchaeum tengchongense]MCW1305774.1 TIGR00269 family protein [Candidatus Jingweiarchaeum tengchongense]MCW1310170.1 TIGR00269 family protein [Candidatus Jingweiarchaeum tengchongense]
MKCSICNSKAIIEINYLEKRFCEKCFRKSFESRVLKNIEKNKLINPNERIAIASSGGKDSLSVLFFIKKFFPKNDIFCLTIDEGIEGYRNITIENVRKYCKEWGIEYHIFSFKDEMGLTLDEIIKIRKHHPCSICGILRRYLMNKKARELNAEKIVTGHNLDDESQAIMMNFFQNDFRKLIRLGAIAGIFEHEKFVSRVKPFRIVSEKETTVYALINNINAFHLPCPYSKFAFRGSVRDFLNEIEKINPSAKINIIHTFDAMFNKMKREFAKKGEDISNCTVCGEPSSQKICSVCQIKEELKQCIQ